MRYIKPLAFLFLLFMPAILRAQDENVRGAIAIRSGLLIIWNEPGNNFTVEIKGKTVERVPNKNLAFMIDGKFLQIVTALDKDFLTDTQKQQKLDERTTLLAHRDWELKYLEQTVGEKLTVDSEEISIPNSKPALIWTFPVPPKDRDKVKKQVFLSVCKAESVLVLNGAVTSDADENVVRRFLLETVATLKIREKPLSRGEAVELASKAN